MAAGSAQCQADRSALCSDTSCQGCWRWTQLLAGDAAVADGVIHDLLSCLLILPGDEISWAYNYYKCLLDSTTLLDILLHKFVPH